MFGVSHASSPALTKNPFEPGQEHQVKGLPLVGKHGQDPAFGILYQLASFFQSQ
jgi:hypothetical protein